MNARPVHQMPRRNRRQQHQRDLDFEIHEDPPTTNGDDAGLLDERSEVRDFASALHSRRFSNDGYDYHAPHLVNEMTDSNLTKASTLVNETGDEHVNSMLEDLEAEKQKLAAAAAPDDNDRIEEDETFGGEMEPDEKAVMDSELEDPASRRESSNTHNSDEDDAASSRRESGVSAISTSSHLSGHETSESRRESAISSTSHRSGTDATGSRRESAISLTSEHSRHSFAHSEQDVQYPEDAEAEFAETSLHEDAATEDTASRRESAVSVASHSTHDRQTDISYSRRGSTASGITHDQYTEASDSRRESAVSGVSNNYDRRASGRTEALIQQAARDIITEIEKQKSGLSTPAESVEDHQSTRSDSRATSTRPSDAHASVKDYQSTRSESRMSNRSDARASVKDSHSTRSESRMSGRSDAHASVKSGHSTRSDSRMSSARPSESHESFKDYRSNASGSRPASARPSDMHTPVPDAFQASVEDEAEDNNSSQNEHEDDVFSDHSPRSSVGSMSEAEHRKLEDTVTHRTRSTRSPRISDFSRLDDEQDEDDFIPTVRGTPRPPFRSPSQVRAMQMSSPPPSVIGSPRSSKRTPLPTVSRLGSPMSGMQYSPKKTPPRFKRNTPPLVLLHVTLLPLQWPWGHVLESAHPDDLSQGAKNVRDTWRQLQDRMGDTTCERGILLPHPQEDFEILEERLLEALELPLRRRARILECGHYLGPSNEMTLADESDTEDEYPSETPRYSRSSAFERQTHWCGTCQTEIRYDALGPGKVFRIKIYASNGLMKAGAWEACWKEMERVDVELEPIVEPAVQDEISHYAIEQEKAMELHQPDDLEHEGALREDLPEEPEASFLENESSVIYNAPSSPPPSVPPPNINEDEERRWRDEERLREIYGHTPPGHAEHSSGPENPPMPSSEYTQRDTPASPSAEAYARREERRHSVPPKTDSLPELLLEALKVMMLDKKNVMIVIMGVMMLVLALRVGGSTDAHRDAAMFQPIMEAREAPTVTVTERAPVEQETAASVVPSIESLSSSASVATPSVEDTLSEATVSEAQVSETTASEATESAEPCATPETAEDSKPEPEIENERDTVVSERIVRVVETVTEVSIETATVTATETFVAMETSNPLQEEAAQEEETAQEEAAQEEAAQEEAAQEEAAQEESVHEETVHEKTVHEEIVQEDTVLEEAVEETAEEADLSADVLDKVEETLGSLDEIPEIVEEVSEESVKEEL